MNNIQKTEDWIMMALEDHGESKTDFKDGRFPSSVFHAQQCTEKALKGLVTFFGIAHEKTHFPSEIYNEEKADELIKYSIEILNLLFLFFSSIKTQKMDKLAGEISKCLKK